MSLPTSGRAYVDAGIFIYTVELHPVYAPLLRPFWQRMDQLSVAVVTSELTLLEVMVGAYRAQDAQLIADYRTTLTHPGLELVAIDQKVLDKGAGLRASLRLRTPDAIHVATALLAGCDTFVTNDKGLRGAPLPNVVVPDDLR